MSPHALLLVLTAAFLHASWNLLSKKAKGKTPFIWLIYVAGNIVYLPFLFFQTHIVYSLPLLLFSFNSAVLHLGYYIVLQKGYRSADLSVVYPLARGSAPLFSSVTAVFFLHEQIRISVTIGLFLIITGVLLITGVSFKRENNLKKMPGITYGLLTGLFIALYTINDTVGVKSYAVSPFILTLATNLFGTLLLTPFVISEKKELKREIKQHKWIIISIAILSPAAYILVLEALRYAPLTVVAPARETSILLGVFMGTKVLNEADGKRRLVASLLILGGIISLSLG
ncbi:DMT family transporter [Foetidibacter luteolus]|uniref:DMT family transporter n=1 Tax=Foetidibacter luteolus TaxID=2608880 RepID=UPI00129B1004|nr:DMT family transporter [Foetidibacter luteolus]